MYYVLVSVPFVKGDPQGRIYEGGGGSGAVTGDSALRVREGWSIKGYTHSYAHNILHHTVFGLHQVLR